jgi:hypothetical protein
VLINCAEHVGFIGNGDKRNNCRIFIRKASINLSLLWTISGWVNNFEGRKCTFLVQNEVASCETSSAAPNSAPSQC